jgi:hypothetical protein
MSTFAFWSNLTGPTFSDVRHTLICCATLRIEQGQYHTMRHVLNSSLSPNSMSICRISECEYNADLAGIETADHWSLLLAGAMPQHGAVGRVQTAMSGETYL